MIILPLKRVEFQKDGKKTEAIEHTLMMKTPSYYATQPSPAPTLSFLPHIWQLLIP